MRELGGYIKTWKKENISEIATIEKCVAEFIIRDKGIIPFDKFKLGIFRNQRGYFNGYTNIGIILDGCPEFGVGFGNTIEEALEDTIQNFINEVTNRKNELGKLTDSDFEWADPHDF